VRMIENIFYVLLIFRFEISFIIINYNTNNRVNSLISCYRI
jgi:hypothetical protein